MQPYVMLSAAQPQPNARGLTIALVVGVALCRAALKGATSSPNGEMQVRSATENFGGKSLEPRANMRFPRRLSYIILQRPPCCNRTACCQRSRYRQTEQARGLRIFANMIDFSL